MSPSVMSSSRESVRAVPMLHTQPIGISLKQESWEGEENSPGASVELVENLSSRARHPASLLLMLVGQVPRPNFEAASSDCPLWMADELQERVYPVLICFQVDRCN